MYGNWETGPWFGFKLPGDDSYAWIGGGTKIFDFMVRMLVLVLLSLHWCCWSVLLSNVCFVFTDLETHVLLHQQEDGKGETC